MMTHSLLGAFDFTFGRTDAMERDFYLTEYLGEPCSQMKCILKQRYSDFIVNEITCDQKITGLCPFVCLFAMHCAVAVAVIHECMHATLFWRANEICRAEDSLGVVNDTDEVKKSINDEAGSPPDGISSDQISEIDELLKDSSKSVKISTECHLISSFIQNMDKTGRTKIHEWVRQRYNGKLSSQTRDQSIVISCSGNDNRKRRIWPEDRPDYLHFTLSKENKDSLYAVSLIAKFLGIKASNFGLCGLKDRRAITSQRVSLYRIDAERVRALNPRLRGIRLSDFSYAPEACQLGQLWGNQFKIILRSVNNCTDDVEINRRLNEFRQMGFINYFGTQRFGSCGIDTAEVGIAILKKDYEAAVRKILKQRPLKGCLNSAIEEWNQSGDASAAVKKLFGGQGFASIEARLLSSLSNAKGDFNGALMRLPRNNRSLYVHAYQSLLWNKIVSRRIQKYGCSVLEGDIDVEGAKLKETDDISRVALPLPSSDMNLPENEVSDWYEECMQEDGVTREMFKSLESQYAIGGVLRPMVVKVENVAYELLKYPDNDTRLQPDLNGEYDEDKIGSGDLKAVSLTFSLQSGCYATVALRQLTR
ncbi:unnamed protein product [Anisakis simplex]|uniref:Putative pseudouridine synthase (inferred by orthology to a C. elegans protein) n=1 Tax=Anisakis simplex TaxID=6269 RepID=A0A0M3KAX7_ANISI|nr:unnamed protein product [Anisakis simplex]